MKSRVLIFVLFLSCKIVDGRLNWDTPRHALDQNLYEEVLDAELCEKQLNYMASNDKMLMFRFFDSGMRIPKGMLDGNLADYGNYYQCLNINEELEDMIVEGKYCRINVPLSQENLQLPSFPEIPDWPEFPWPEFNSNTSQINEETLRHLKEYNLRRSGVQMLISPRENNDVLSSLRTNMGFKLGICIPKPCKIQHVMDTLGLNTTSIGLDYHEEFCRLPNDKPWVPADYVAVTILSVFGLLTLLSTCYDMRHTIILAKDPKKANTVLKSFSVYTNTRRLLTFASNPDSLECIDGIRSIAMMWVVVGHCFSSNTFLDIINPLELGEYLVSLRAVWITSAPITVDTFFMLSGLLIVYTTAGKLTRMKLLKNIHFFYLNRILRMLPILASAVLLQASLFNRIADGPFWNPTIAEIHKCRTYWWSTLLFIQNYVNPLDTCLPHTWYLAVDMQLHILSPLVLFWVLGNKRLTGWIAITTVLLVSITVASIYCFMNNFAAVMGAPSNRNEPMKYLTHYYFNTVTRASPFFVGMFYGYMLHLWRGKELVIPKVQAALLWAGATLLSTSVIYSTYPAIQRDWDNQIINNIMNSFMRPVWAMAIGWLIFACVHGYGGPINWFLSLHVWKLPARLSYAMYIFHYPIIIAMSSTALSPVYFAVDILLRNFMTYFSITLVVAFLVTLLVDAPFTTLIKLLMGGGPKKSHDKAAELSQERQNGSTIKL